MTSTVAFDASPASFLRALRGAITDARMGYADMLHIELRDSLGAVRRLATQDAEVLCADSDGLRGKSIQDAELNSTTGERRLALGFGPGLRWQISPADDAVGKI